MFKISENMKNEKIMQNVACKFKRPRSSHSISLSMSSVGYDERLLRYDEDKTSICIDFTTFGEGKYSKVLRKRYDKIIFKPNRRKRNSIWTHQVD